MRPWYLATGITLLILGLLVIAVARTPTITEKEDRIALKEGGRNEFELNDVPLNQGDKFIVAYSGGRSVPPDEIDVMIYNPNGNTTVIPYVNEWQTGIIANYTGTYKMQILGIFIDESRPFVMYAQEINEYIVVEYPNSNLLPLGVTLLIVGPIVAVWAAKTSRRKPLRNKAKRYR